MDLSLPERVRERAGGCWEYCRMPEVLVRLAFQVDHIIAEQHGGLAILSNLAWSCLPCNKRKGPNTKDCSHSSGKNSPDVDWHENAAGDTEAAQS